MLITIMKYFQRCFKKQNLNIFQNVSKCSTSVDIKKKVTDELLAQVIQKNEMYVDWKTTSCAPITHPDYEKVKFNFKGYKKIVLKGIERAKRDYFDRVFWHTNVT